MKLDELREKLEALGIPVHYRAFPISYVPELPYLLFYVDGNQGTLKADNYNYYRQKQVTLELYTEEKDSDLENKLEELLDANRLSYDSYEAYLPSESMYEVAYEIII